MKCLQNFKTTTKTLMSYTLKIFMKIIEIIEEGIRVTYCQMYFTIRNGMGTSEAKNERNGFKQHQSELMGALVG